MHKTSNTSRKSQWNESGSGRKKIKLHRGISLSLNTVLIFLIFCNFSVIHNGRFNFKHLLYNVEHLLWLHLSDPVLRLKITISCTYYCSAEWKISLHFSRMHKQENLKKSQSVHCNSVTQELTFHWHVNQPPQRRHLHYHHHHYCHHHQRTSTRSSPASDVGHPCKFQTMQCISLSRKQRHHLQFPPELPLTI